MRGSFAVNWRVSAVLISFLVVFWSLRSRQTARLEKMDPEFHGEAPTSSTPSPETQPHTFSALACVR